MGIYNIYYFPNAAVPYKHIFLKRNLLKQSSLSPVEIIKETIENDKKLENNLIRAKTNLTNLLLCNDFDYFCTFEFRGSEKLDRFDLNSCYKALRKFFNNYQQRYAPDFKYLIVPEFHPKTKAIHFHGVCSGFAVGDIYKPEKVMYRDAATDELKQMPNTKGYLRWDRYTKSLGFFDCSPIKNRNACAFYMRKYITKDLIELPKGTRVYAASAGLSRPELIETAVTDYEEMSACYEDEFCKIMYDGGGDTAEYFERQNRLNPWGTGRERFSEIVYAVPDVYCREKERIDALTGDLYTEEWDIEYEQQSIR